MPEARQQIRYWSKAGFTLAEVLITLGIIGIVAAITIPTLASNIQSAILKNQFKKFYSIFNQAVMGIQTIEGRPIKCFYWKSNPYDGICTRVCERNEYGTSVVCQCQETGAPLPSDYLGSFSDCQYFYNQLFHNTLKVAKVCERNAYNDGCLPDDIRGSDIINKELNPDKDFDPNGEFSDRQIKNNYPAIVLQDGTYIIKFGGGGHLSGGSPVFAFDINGKKGPNKWGYDLFGVIFYGNSTDGIKEFASYVTPEKGGKLLTEMYKESFRK